jgi:hypothetical protein
VGWEEENMAAWIVFIALWFIYVLAVKGKLSSLEHRIAETELEMSSVLKQRAELVSDLAASVRGPSKRARELLRFLDEAESSASLPERIEAFSPVDGMLDSLVKDGTVSEPSLLDQLGENGGRMKDAIGRYNALAKELDVTIGSFPSKWIARGHRGKPPISSEGFSAS